jgi:Ca2+-binding EF-hand superfamily protein
VRTNRTFTSTFGATLLLAAIASTAPAFAQQKSSNTSSGAKLWLAKMDTDHDGTVSKQEFLAYMQAQFDAADPDHDGTLDANELQQLQKTLGIAIKAPSTQSSVSTASAQQNTAGLTPTAAQQKTSNNQSTTPASAQQKISSAPSGGKLWLAKMDTDHDGSVSKQEFTAYMEAQFDKADPDHDGTLDVNELQQLRKNLMTATKGPKAAASPNTH